MEQVRFTVVVEQSGNPEVYLLLLDPKKDEHFQTALKANRVMTIQQAGGKTNFGTVGYAPGPRAQVLIFPRRLRIPPDAHVVGIKFDLLDQEHEPEKPVKARAEEPVAEPEKRPKLHIVAEPERKAPTEPAPKKKELAKPASTSRRKKKSDEDQPELLLEREAPRPPAQVIPFHNDEDSEEDESEKVAEVKKEVRRALKALEAGKQVAAFNILKKILE